MNIHVQIRGLADIVAFVQSFRADRF